MKFKKPEDRCNYFLTALDHELLDKLRGSVDPATRAEVAEALARKNKIRKAGGSAVVRFADGLKNKTRALRNLSEQAAELHKVALIDGLTGIHNKKAFDNELKSEFKRAIRYKQDLALIYLDIDFFKKVNDEYGHDAGDLVLKKLASILKERIRDDVDFAARIGGEEFAVLLPVTDIDGAQRVAEDLRLAFDAAVVEADKGKDIQATASFGVTMLDKGDSEADLRRRADQALYLAKHEGRNRVAILRANGGEE